MPYDPPRQDRSAIDLTGSTMDLIERLARHNHDAWARIRLDEGYVYGPELDPLRKTHPMLVAYDDLPEAQKEVDRQMAIATWKQLVVNGFRVLPPSETWRASDTAADAHARSLCDRLESGEPLPHAEIIGEWSAQQQNPRRWASQPSLYGLFAQQLLQVGEPHQSFDVATAGLSLLPGNPALLRWRCLALLELGATRRAIDALVALRARRDDAETRGFLGYARLRHADELAGRVGGDPRAQRSPQQERETLELAYEDFRGATSERPVWRVMFRVGAALTAWRLGGADADDARRRAEDALDAFVPTAVTAIDLYWRHAFAGLLAMVSPDPSGAIGHFRECMRHADRRYGLINITARLARALAHGLDEQARRAVEQCFGHPSVVVFAGHMFDQPGQQPPRFPECNAALVKNAIRGILGGYGHVIGFASAAAGADLLFHEVVHEMGGESHVVLPYAQESFFRDSVALRGLDAAAMRAQFDGVLGRSVECSSLCGQQLVPGSGSYDYCNRILFGMALLHADRVAGVVRPLCVWNGKPGNGVGGTATVAQMWMECGYMPTIVTPPEAPPAAVAGPGVPEAPPAVRPVVTANQAILFADVRGYSTLSDEQVAEFIEFYIGAVGDMCRPSSPIFKHTSGDGLYLVFRTCREAGLFGLDLAELRQRRGAEFTARGLPEDLGIRVAIHYGPMLFRMNPVTDRPEYFGQHVSRAARLEPVTAVNSVFVTYEFAAWSRTENVTEFACDYLGTLEFAKAYGDSGAYALRRLG